MASSDRREVSDAFGHADRLCYTGGHTTGAPRASFLNWFARPRFLSARREVNEVYYSHSPCAEEREALESSLSDARTDELSRDV